MINMRIDDLLETKLDYIKHNTTDDEKDIIVNKFFNHFRSKGFPYYNLSNDDILKSYNRLLKVNYNKMLLDDNVIQQNMSGLDICNNFHPQMFGVKCRNLRTPLEVFNDDVLFKKAIRKRIMMSDCCFRDYNLRKALKIYSGTQSVSNFKPTVASYLYRTYGGKDCIVLDPCMGYGGRLLGAMVSDNVKSYVAFDPDTKAFNGNDLMADKLQEMNKEIYVELIQQCFEDAMIKDNLFDLIFTSPPYYDAEKYSNEDTQSWVRYDTYEKWSKNFLKVLIDKSYSCLKNDRYFIINVAGDNIIRDVLVYAELAGFDLVETLYMRLSKMPGKGIDKVKDKFKLEPIFVFHKK